MIESMFKPTLKMAAAARRGLRLHKTFERGSTRVGVGRAHEFSERRSLDAKDIKAMHSFSARHAVDKDTKPHAWESDCDPSAGFTAWLLWGGDAARPGPIAGLRP